MIEITQSPRYHCISCDCDTSGVINPEGPRNRRYCLCRKPLLHCEHCGIHTSGTKAGDKITCDKCGKGITRHIINIKMS